MLKRAIICLIGSVFLLVTAVQAKTMRLVYTDAQGTVIAKTEVAVPN
jgi:hypothetical protein